MNTIAKLLVLLVGAGLYWVFHFQQTPLATTDYVLPKQPNISSAPFKKETWVSNQETNEAHSASIALLKSGQPVVVWYGGTEEGHADVALFLATLDESWSKPTIIADRLNTEIGLMRFIRKVGNPTLHVWPDGNLGVFYVSVSVGGWGASAINYMESADQGKTWTQPKRLVTSPFLNISTLVRTNPIEHADGNIELPIYHEFAGKFSESLIVSRDIEVLDKRRISWGKDSLQPAIAPMDESTSLALLRYAGTAPGRLWSAKSKDVGNSWTTPELLDLPNPNAAVALLNTGDGNLLLALNDTEDGRSRLSLATRKIDNGQWQIVKTLEAEVDTADTEYEFSYPSFVMDLNGNVHLVYTWNQKRIKHVQFNLTWLNDI